MTKTQFSIDVAVKNKLDKFKANRKEEIIAKYQLPRIYVSNTHAIAYLLDLIEEKKRKTK